MTNSCIGSAPAVYFLTMGCAKNEVDSEHMKARCSAAGCRISEVAEDIDVIVVNTCSFIQAATEESIEAIFDAAGLPDVERGRTKLIVAGCMPARYGEGLESELSEAGAFVPCNKEDDIVEVISELLDVELTVPEGASITGSMALESSGATATYAYVKISDGCDRFCSYCTIPFIRGRYHSFEYETIASEVAGYVDCGVKEIVLIAQDTGRWGDDFEPKQTLAGLIRKLAAEFPETWFRVMYIQPEGISDELLHAVAENENVCSYFDIPLQHVNPEILKSMNRNGSAEEFVALTERIRSIVPDVTLRTTLIAGYPGETEEMFEELCDFVSEGLFDYMGVFPYSREEGTRAYKLEGQLDEDEKNERATRLRDIADASCTPLIAERIGKSVKVLIEGVEEDGQVFGRAMCQAPDVDGVTYVDEGEIGEVVEVKILDTLMYEMEGE